jgi:hypothetical protein
MDKSKRKRLERSGWRIGSEVDFLGLTEEEATLIDLTMALSKELRDRRQKNGITQTAFARLIGSSQSRVAKMEAGDPSVSFDLLIRGLLATGASGRDIAAAIGRMPSRGTSRPNTRTRG